MPSIAEAVSEAIGSGSLIPAGTMYVALETPIGVATIDPFAAAQDQTTQQILQALGIHVTFGLGAPPPDLASQPSLGENLKVLGLVGAGLLALWWFGGRR